jgi:SAM-dependent methyltransferase
VLELREGLDGSQHGNLQKHLNPNPIQRWLLNRFHRRILELVGTTDARRILDAGCGEGFVMCELRESGIQVPMIGVDFSSVALAWNQAYQMARSPLSAADIRHLPFRDDSFDLVLCLEVLEHLPDSALGLRELLRVSQDYVLVSVPHEPFFRAMNFLRGRHMPALGNDPDHLHNYSGRVFRRLVAAHADLVWHGYSFPWQIAMARWAG